MINKKNAQKEIGNHINEIEGSEIPEEVDGAEVDYYEREEFYDDLQDIEEEDQLEDGFIIQDDDGSI